MKTLECIEVNPNGTAATIIWLHGLGASGDDFVPIVPLLQLPDVRFIFPHAPMRPVTINAGYVMRAWYDIKTMEESEFREDERDIDEATLQIENLITAEKERGTPSNKILLVGFSQGAAMALHVGHRHSGSLAGIMCLSGYLLLEGRWTSETSPSNINTPMFFAHGDYDDVVPCHRGAKALDAFQNDERSTEWHTYPMGHELCPPQIVDIRHWLHKQVGP